MEGLVQCSGSGFRQNLAVVAPRADVLASGGASFIRQVRDEHLGVEWGGCFYLGLEFSSQGSGSLLEELVQGYPYYVCSYL